MQDKQPQECIYRQADVYFNNILAAIQMAQSQIDMEVYIFELDIIGKQVSQALIQAAKRGIKVRLLVDGMGVGFDFVTIAKQLQSAGAQVRIHRPLPWHFKQWSFSLAAVKGMQKFWYLLSYINKRNHRKLIIIDQKSVFLGSFNISQKHLSSIQGGENWRDTAIKLDKINTRAIQSAFEFSWNKRKFTAIKHLVQTVLNSPFRFNFTRHLRQAQHKQLLLKIAQAKKQIWITNAYFVPDAKLLSTLMTASYRGVDVRIVLPYRSDVFFIPWAASFFYEKLLVSGARIYEYQSGMLHAKTLIIDDWASIGSSNFNRRSLNHDLEVDYSLQLNDSINQLEHDFLDDIKQSEELCQYELNTKKPWQRYLGGLILFLFSYWL